MLSHKLSRARIVELIEVVLPEGDGTEEFPVRLVSYYLTKDGEPVARTDSLEAELDEWRIRVRRNNDG